jgi:formate hydrogenlyase subunit 4
MTGRTAALIATLALIALLTVLTVDVMIEQGIDILVLLSLLVLGMFGFGVVGALTNPPKD